MDRNNTRQDNDFNSQVEEALRGCASFVLVLTSDCAISIDAEREWRRALQYKKPVILAQFQPGVEPPLLLNNRRLIDFRGDLSSASEALQTHLLWRSTPEGVLLNYKEQLADAQRDLRSAYGEDHKRIMSEIEILGKQIAEQERILRDPDAAARRTQANIESGLERERQPEKPATDKARTRFINPPPGVAPTYFQDRFLETQLIGDFLKDPALRLMTVVGRAGIGKTILVCRLLKALEHGRLPDEGGPMPVEGIVYLSAIGTRRIRLTHLLADLSKLLPDSQAKEVDALFRDAKVSPKDKMAALLAHFPPHAGEAPARPAVVLLDNFEDLVDPETQALRDVELEEGLQAFLDAPPHRVKVLLTTRQSCRSLLLLQPARQQKLELDEGLETPYAENILRAMDRDGKVGLKTASDELLAQARERTRGYPRALEALYAILSADRYTRLSEVLASAEHLLPEEVVEALVGQAYSRLDPAAQRVLQALAVYARPVPPAAVDYLLQPSQPGLDSAQVLHRLVSMHFVHQEGGKYYLHPVDRAYALARIPSQPEGEPFTHSALLHRAAEYFAQTRLPRSEWKSIDDLAAQLAEIELRCAAGEQDTAGQVLREIGFEYLFLWGHVRLLIELHEPLQGRLTDPDLQMSSLNMLGAAYTVTGQMRKAIGCYEQGLALAREAEDRGWEGAFLGNLGNAYAYLGQTARAIEYYQQALTIRREIGDRRGEAFQLGQLGEACIDQDQFDQVIELLTQACQIADAIGNTQLQNEIRSQAGLACLLTGDLAASRIWIEQAGEYDWPQNNAWVAALSGIIALHQGQPTVARQAFQRAVEQANQLLAVSPQLYDLLDASSLALCGLALLEERDQREVTTQAIGSFRAARAVNRDAGVVRRVLRLFDLVALHGTNDLLKEIRPSVEGS
jgi:tetratricopeptide (TPR) repeat protein